MRALDVARAMAVIAVVVAHAIDGLVAARLIPADSLVVVLNTAFAMSRMPTLAFVIGVFIPGGVARYGAIRYTARRVMTMIWVYLLWTAVQGAVQVAANRWTNSTLTFDQAIRIWDPIGQLWFLPFVAAATVIVVVTRPWRGAWGLVRLAALILVSSLLWGRTPGFAGVQGIALVAFVGVGAALGMERAGRLLSSSAGSSAAVGAGALLAFAAAMALDPSPASTTAHLTWVGALLSMVTATLGVVALLCLSALLARLPAAGWLGSIGRDTLPIFVLHVSVVAGVRVLLEPTGLPVTVLLVAQIVLGVGLPWWIGEHAERWRLGWMFRPPTMMSGFVSAHRGGR